MAVNLSDAEIRQFELAGITKEDIGKTIERDRAAGLSDQDITLKASIRANQLEKENLAFEGSVVRGGLRAISNLPFGDTINRGLMGINALDNAYTSVPDDTLKAAYNATLDYLFGNNKPTLRQYLEAPEGTTPPDRSWNQLYHDNYNALRESKGETFSENYNENMKKLERTFQEQNYDVPKWVRYTLDTAGTIGSYGLLPEGIYSSVPSAAAFGAADAFQEGIKTDEKNRTRDRIVNALIGGAVSGAVTGAVNKITGASAMKKAEKEYPLLAEGFKKNPPKSTEEAVDRITINYVKNSLNPSLEGRASAEAEKLFSNLDTRTLKDITWGNGTPHTSPLGKAMTKNLESAMNLGDRGAVKKALKAVKALNKLTDVSAAAKPSTEGLTGGVTGFLAGNWISGPVGGIAGALIGSGGKIGNALSGAGELLLGESGQRLTKAMVNPQGTNAVSRALRKVATPAAGEVAKKANIPVGKFLQNEDVGVLPKKISYEPKPSKKNLVPNNYGQQPFVLPNNTTVVLPDNDSGESIMQKHLQLLAALYPQYYQKVA